MTGCESGIETWRRRGERRFAPSSRRFVDLGEDMLVFTVLQGRGRQSGVEVELPAAMIVRSRDGRLVYFKGYGHREDALKELDVSEDALEPITP
jgi:hypothetical protein